MRDDFPVDQDHALVALRDLGNVALRHHAARAALVIVSTMTLRFGSSARTRNTFSPPITSSRFTTMSRSASMNAWMRSGSRETSVAAVKRANSAIASFSLWSRIASGR